MQKTLRYLNRTSSYQIHTQNINYSVTFTNVANIFVCVETLKNYLAFMQHSDVTSLNTTIKSEQYLAKGQQIPISLITETNDTVSPM